MRQSNKMVLKLYCLLLFATIFVSCQARVISEETLEVPESLTRERRAIQSAYHMIKKRSESGSGVSGGGGNDIISQIVKNLPGMAGGLGDVSQMNTRSMVTYIMNTILQILSDFGLADPPKDGSSSSGSGGQQSQAQAQQQSKGQNGQKGSQTQAQTQQQSQNKQ